MTDVFDQQAERYDAWYDTPSGGAVVAEERDALRPLLASLPHPWLEVGVGTGRFAAGLGAEFGIDSASRALSLARRGGVFVAVATGEALPFAAEAFGAILVVTALCFVADPLEVLLEARRVIRPDGGVVLGVVPRESAWGQHYRELAAQGHPYYARARFLGRPELAELFEAAHLRARHWRSALLWPPSGEPAGGASAAEGDRPEAGFLAILAGPRP